ncbi:hypothetical protein ACFQ1I_32840 [Kitasatospora arboriphila]
MPPARPRKPPGTEPAASTSARCAGAGLPASGLAEAQSAAQYYLRAAGADGDATATADTVTVTVRRTQPMQLLTLVGISSLTVTATASAHPVETGRA